MPIEIFYEDAIIGRDGKIRWKSGLTPSHSFVIQFMKHIEAAIEVANKTGVKGTDGTNHTIPYHGSDTQKWGDCSSGTGEDSYGIVVGSGTSATSNTDYALESKIPNGTGAGQLQYNDQTNCHANTKEVSGNVDFVFWRTFTNNSGGNVTVNEIGVYAKTFVSSPVAQNRYFLFVRDKLSSSRTIANGETYQVTYTFRTTV